MKIGATNSNLPDLANAMLTRSGDDSPRPATEAASGSLRNLVLLLVVLGTIGLTIELLLLEHTESGWQRAPLVILVAGVLSASATARWPTYRQIRFLQAMMILFIATGLLGLYLHYRGNTEFELEMDRAAQGFDLLWRSLHGATPVLAPGAMVQLGLFGLAYTFRHPALRRGREVAG